MRRVARLLLWLAALLIAATAAGIVALVSIDPNRHKDWIAAKVLERTGRALSLEGDIAISFYPWLGLEVNGVNLGHAPGFGDGVFLHADYARLRVKTLPLLRDKYEIDTAQARGAALNLARNEQGVGNWEDLMSADSDGPARAWTEALSSTVIGGVAVEDAMVVWDDRQAAARYEVFELNATVAELRYGEPIDLALSFRGRSDKPAVEAAVQLDGVIAYDRDGDRYRVSPLNARAVIKSKHLPSGETAAGLSAVVEVGLDDETARVSDLELKGLGTVVRGRLSASRMASATPSISADLEGQGDDLALLFKVAEVEPLASQLARLQERGFQFSAKATADLERGDLELTEVSARLLGATLTGAARARDFRSDAPSYQGKLKARGPDLPLLMQVLGQLQPGSDNSLTRYGKKLAGRAPGAFEATAEFDGDLKSGTMSIPVLSAQVLGLALAGGLDAKNMQSPQGTVSGALKVSGAELAPLLGAFDQAELAQVLRAVEFNANIAGTRASVAFKPLTMEAVFVGEGIPNSPATVVMDADATLNLDADAATLKRVSLKGLGTVVRGRLSASRIASATPSISADLEGQGDDLALLFKVAGVEPLASQLARLQERGFQFSAKATADLERGDLELSEASARLLGATLTGAARTRDFRSDAPSYQGKLKAQGPDLPLLMQALGQLQSGQDSSLTRYGKKLAGRAPGAFEAAAEFDGDLKSGTVSIPALSAQALGLAVAGGLDARNMQSPQGRVSGALKVSGAELAPLLGAFDQAELAQILRAVKFNANIAGTRAGVVFKPLTMEAVFAGEGIPNSPATVVMDADATLNLDADAATLKRVSLKGLGLALSGAATARKLSSEPVFSGRFELQPFNLRQLAGQLKQPLPVVKDQQAFGRLALSGRFDGGVGELKLSQLQAQLDDALMTGEVSLEGLPEEPAIGFNLKVDELNVDRYMPLTPEPAEGPAATPQEPQPEAEVVVPVDAIRKLNLDGSLTVDKLTIANAALSQARLSLKANAGVLRAAPIAANLYEGRFSGDIELDVNPAIPRLSFNSSLKDIQVEPLFQDVTGQARARGKGDFSAALSTAGGASAALKRNLEGRIDMSFNEVAIIGFDLGKHLRQWRRFKTGDASLSLEVKRTEATGLSELSGHAVAQAGVFRMDDLQAKAPAFRLTGKGVLADLRNDAIDYRLDLKVADTGIGVGGKELSKLLGVDLPVDIKGPLDDPKVELHWGRALAALFANQLMDLIPLPNVPGILGADEAKDDEKDKGTGLAPVDKLLKKGVDKIFKKKD